jgi:TolA-binding protein
MTKAVVSILALTAQLAFAAPAPTTCGGTSDYERALCAYQRRNFGEAERALRAIAEREVQDPHTIRALYFLARTQMKTGRFDEAHAILIRIYELDSAFYATWNGDYLLGECRKALGK